MRFSIIIPVYNVEEYLRKCLESIANQTYSDYEVIIVDDETPDNSMVIAEEFRSAYPEKIKILHQKNTGQGGARNNGAAIAKGEYLLFVDSDDFVHERMLEILDQRLQENPCEILVFNYYTATPSGEVLSDVSIVHSNCIVTGHEKNVQLQNPPAPWNKAYLRSFYIESGFMFPQRLLYEDAFTRLLIAKANRIQLCTESLYYYVLRPNSAMTSRISPRVLDIKTIVDRFIEQCIEDGIYAEYRDGLDASMIGSLVCVMELIDKQAAKHPYKRELVEYFMKKFPDYEANPVLLPIVKKKVKCLVKGSRTEYHIRFTLIPSIKRTLLKIPAVSRINDFRKNRK